MYITNLIKIDVPRIEEVTYNEGKSGNYQTPGGEIYETPHYASFKIGVIN